MSFSYFPFYTGDYLRDTRHLTPEEHGIYMLLLFYCWDQKGPAPLDERKLSGITNARSGGEIESMRRVLAEFFTRMDDGYYNKRVAEELIRVEAAYQAAVERGKKSAEVRAAKYGSAQPIPFREHPESLSTSSGKPPEVTRTITRTITKSKKEENIFADSRQPAAPIGEVIDLYHSICTGLPRMQVRNSQRESHISARWRQIFADGAVSTREDGLTFFSDYFERVNQSRFLSGRAPAGPGRRVFRADLPWLMNPDNFAKVIEGKYDDELRREKA